MQIEFDALIQDDVGLRQQAEALTLIVDDQKVSDVLGAHAQCCVAQRRVTPDAFYRRAHEVLDGTVEHVLLHEIEFEDVVFGPDAAHAMLVHHQDAADAFLLHAVRRDVQWRVAAAFDDALRHHLFDQGVER
jgi:hypothetical protein